MKAQFGVQNPPVSASKWPSISSALARPLSPLSLVPEASALFLTSPGKRKDPRGPFILHKGGMRTAPQSYHCCATKRLRSPMAFSVPALLGVDNGVQTHPLRTETVFPAPCLCGGLWCELRWATTSSRFPSALALLQSSLTLHFDHESLLPLVFHFPLTSPLVDR